MDTPILCRPHMDRQVAGRVKLQVYRGLAWTSSSMRSIVGSPVSCIQARNRCVYRRQTGPRLDDLQHAQQRGRAHVAPPADGHLHARGRERRRMVREPARQHPSPAVRVLARLAASKLFERACAWLIRPGSLLGIAEVTQPRVRMFKEADGNCATEQVAVFLRQGSCLGVKWHLTDRQGLILGSSEFYECSAVLDCPAPLRASCRFTMRRMPAAANTAGRPFSSTSSCHGRAIASTPGVTQQACRPGKARSAGSWLSGSSLVHAAPPAQAHAWGVLTCSLVRALAVIGACCAACKTANAPEKDALSQRLCGRDLLGVCSATCALLRASLTGKARALRVPPRELEFGATH